MLVLAVALTVLAVAWTGWRALHDLDVMAHHLDPQADPVVSRTGLRLVEVPRLTAS